MNSPKARAKAQRLYNGFSLWGVPYNDEDIQYASECLYERYMSGGNNELEAMELILNQNERVVSRCGMLVAFSGTLIALLLFIANKPDTLPMRWQQWVFYAVMFMWVSTTMHLLWLLKHKFPPVWEFHTKSDFALTAGLFLRRMGAYNVALISTLISFTVIAIVLLPISAVISDKIFSP